MILPTEINLLYISAVILLVATFGLVVRRGFSDWVHAYRYQTIVLSGIVALIAFTTNIWELYIVSVLTFGIKAIVIPKILFYVTNKLNSPIKLEVDPYISMRLSVIVSALLVAMSYFISSNLGIKSDQIIQVFLPVSLSLFFIGMFVIISRRKALNQIVGLLTIENGLFLFAVVLTHGLSLIIEIGLMADIVVGVIISSILLFRISRTFDSMDIRNLESLRDD
ncbi:MAG: NADH-quinone oxidoreductase subunit K [Nitrosopumilus sp.]